MSTDSSSGSGTEDLQFDRAIDPDSTSPAGGPVCKKCNAPIRMYYYHVDGETTCSSCKAAVERAHGGGAAAKSGPGLMKAMLFGLGAAIAGAIIYYAVMEYLDLEIGYVAILIGFMVGYAVRAAVAGRGGRRFQILAAGLTYFAVALAYAPFAIRGALKGDGGATADSTATATATAPGTAAVASTDAAGVTTGQTASSADEVDDAASGPEEESLGASGIALGIGGALLLILTLPVLVIFGSMPSGLISALIIGIGMHQAWKMTRATELSITGPFKIGSGPAPVAA